MANIIINDILDELRDENNRLFNENKVIYDLLVKYRNFSLSLQNICVCNQKSNTNFVIKSLEKDYQRISYRNENQIIESKKISEKPSKDKTLECNDFNGRVKNIDSKETESENQLSDESDSKYIPEEVEREKSLKRSTTVPNNTETKHYKTIPKQVIECNICQKTFNFRSNLFKHMYAVHPSEEKVYNCNFCNYSSKFNEYVRRHTKRVHLKSVKHQSIKTKTVKCDVEDCRKMFKTLKGMNEHKSKFHSTKHIEKERSSSGQSSERSVCHYVGCQKTFKYKQSLRIHIQRNHTLEKPFKCDECHKGYVTRTELRSHQRVHAVPHDFQCEECHKKFLNKYTYEQHKQIFHTSFPILYKCVYCTFETRFEFNLKGHIRRKHTMTELTVKCDFDGCPKMFRSYLLMRKHSSHVHNPKNRHVCDWPGCDYSSHDKSSYRDHKRSHLGVREYTCDYEGCAKSFIRNKTLQQHKLSHIKRFVCSWPECGLRFNEQIYLTAHMNKHLNLRPFKCYINDCKSDFRIDRHLKHHIRTIHKTKPKLNPK